MWVVFACVHTYEFDPSMAKQLQDHILSAHIGDGTELGMDFGGMGSGGRNRSRIPSSELLQESNKAEWVSFKLRQILVNDRKKELDAMRKGFWTLPDLGESLSRLNPLDLKTLLSGPSRITSTMVLGCVDFNYGDWDVPVESWIGKGPSTVHAIATVRGVLNAALERAVCGSTSILFTHV